MAGPIQTITLAGRRIYNALFPSQGPMELSVSVDFSLLASQGLHLTGPVENGEIDFIQTVWADNSTGVQTLYIKCESNGQIIQYPAGSIGYQPFLCNSPKITVSCADTAQTSLQIKFINVPISALMTYAASRPGTPTTVTGQLGNNADSVAPVTTGNLGTDSYIYAYDSVAATWNRVRINPNAQGNNVAQAQTQDSLIVTAMLYANAGGSAIPLAEVTAADASLSGGPASLAVVDQALSYNGASWDRRRNNIDTAALVTLAAQAAGTVNSADQTNYNGRGVKLGINTTATTGTITVKIQGKDAASGTYYDIATGTAIAAPGFNLLEVYPGVTTAANISVSDVLPRTWRVSATIGVGGGASATVGASVIL